MMVHFRKRLSASILNEVNDLLIERKVKRTTTYSGDRKGSGGSTGIGGGTEAETKGTLIADATCAPEGMRFPHDVTLFDEARGKTELVIDLLHETMPEGREKLRTYRKVARRAFLRFIRTRKPRMPEIQRALNAQIQYVERNLRSIKEMARNGGLGSLSRKEYRDLLVITEYVRQLRQLYADRKKPIPGRIMSIDKPHVRAIARGKARAMYEFGAKLSVRLVESLTRVERLSWDNYNEGIELREQIQAHRERYEVYPSVVCAYKIYRNRTSLDFCKEKGIRLSWPKLGRPFNDGRRQRDKKRIEREDEGRRVAVEGIFGEAKRTYTLDSVYTKLKETSESAIMLVFLMMNITKISRDRRRLFLLSLWMLDVRHLQEIIFGFGGLSSAA